MAAELNLEALREYYENGKQLCSICKHPKSGHHDGLCIYVDYAGGQRFTVYPGDEVQISPEARFILRQIERAERCSCPECLDSIDAHPRLHGSCRYYGPLRADLLRLQKEVL